MADFDVWHNARAVLDNGTVLEIDNLHTVVGVTHISRGLANMEEEGFADMSGFPPAEAHVYLAAKMVSGAGVFTWENSTAKELEVALSPGQSFELCSAKSFDVDTTAATGTVTDTGLDVAMDAGRGVKLEYMILSSECPECTACSDIDFPEGCQYFSFDYIGDNQLAIVLESDNPTAGNYLTVIAPDGQQYTVPAGDQIDFLGGGQEGSYCAYSSDSEGVPQAATWTGLYMLASAVDLGAIPYSINSLDLSNVQIVGGDTYPALFIEGVSFEAAPDYRYMVGLSGISFGGCFLPALPITTGMGLMYYWIDGCGLTVAPSYTGLVDIVSIVLANNNLPTSEINRVLVEASSSFTSTSGGINLVNQTPAAPPSGAGLTAQAELEGRSPGWTITTD